MTYHAGVGDPDAYVFLGGGGEEGGAAVRKSHVIDGISVSREFQVVGQIVFQIEFVDLTSGEGKE